MLQANKNKGIGLLELMLSLAIIAILLIIATRYYAVTRASEKIDTAVSMVESVYTAASNWYNQGSQFTRQDMILTFVTHNMLPQDFTNPNINPWNSSLEASAPSDGSTQIRIKLNDVPKGDCNNLADKFSFKMSSGQYMCNGSGALQTFVAQYNF